MPPDAPIPKSPAEFAELALPLGDAGLLALIEAHGGTRLTIPKIPSLWLIDLVGTRAADALCAAFSGARLVVPLAKGWRVLVYRSRGMTVEAIARKLSISEDTIYRALRPRAGGDAGGGEAPPERQLPLEF